MNKENLGLHLPALNRTPEHRAIVSAANRRRAGYRHSPETLAKMRQTALGRVNSPEARAKMSVSQRALPVLGECVYCGDPATNRDHVIPRGRPGWEAPDNLVLACRACNASKCDRTPDEWLEAGLYRC